MTCQPSQPKEAPARRIRIVCDDGLQVAGTFMYDAYLSIDDNHPSGEPMVKMPCGTELPLTIVERVVADKGGVCYVDGDDNGG